MGFLDLLKSERGIYSLAVAICATIMLGLGRISPELWAAVIGGGQLAYTIGKSYTSGKETEERGRLELAKTVGAQPSLGELIEGRTFEASSTTVNVNPAPASNSSPSKAGGVIALVLIVLAMLGGCGGKGSPFGTIIGDAVDCTTPGAKSLVKQFGPTLDLVLSRSMTNDGGVDWQTVREASRNFALDAGGCVLATTVARALARVPNPDAPNSAPLAVDKDRLRSGFDALRVEMLGGKRFRTDAGEL